MKTAAAKLMLLCAAMVVGIGGTFGQSVWTKYAGNPVLSGGLSGAWNRHVFLPCVLYNADLARYEMWFSASVGSSGGWRPYRIGFATSADRTAWTVHPAPVLVPGSSGQWDSSTVERPFVIRQNGQYKMWYSSGLGRIGYATSPDGTTWTKYAGNPILGPGTASWEAGGVYTGSVMPVTWGYKMWYSGWNSAFTLESIGYATSVDGILWQRDTVNNPVLEPAVAWEIGSVFFPWVLCMNNTYYIWYGGLGQNVQVGLATSSDGISWNKHPANPVLRPSVGQWDGDHVESGSVIPVGDTLYMWYDASGGVGPNNLWKIGLATSPFIPVLAGDEAPLPTGFLLEQNFPNPFNPVTNLQFTIPHSQFTILTVYDRLGRPVATLVNEVKQPGTYTVQFDGTGLSSGVYFYRLQAGGFVDVKKLILLR